MYQIISIYTMFLFKMLLLTFRGRFITLKGMLVSIIVGGVEGDTTGGRRRVILMSTEVVVIHIVEALDDAVGVEAG